VIAVANLLAWCFDSPRRLFGVLLVGLVVLVGGGAVVRATIGSSASGGSGPVPGVPNDAPQAQQAMTAALTFARAWASKPASLSAEQWRAQLAPLATPDLMRGLAVTDPASLPGGTPQGSATVRFVSVSSSLIEVPLSTGTRVLVTVVLLNGRWVASDVQPAVGDAGNVPPASALAPAPAQPPSSASAG
jgi:hypothetical protein